MRIVLIIIIMSILLGSCSNSQKASTKSGRIILLSPLIKGFDMEFPNELDKLRIISVIESKDLLQLETDKINHYYYKNLDRIFLPNEELKNRIATFLKIKNSKKNHWYLNWNNYMSIDESNRAKEIIGIDFCAESESVDIILPKGYSPVLNLDYFEKLGEYNYVSDILGAYELSRLFEIKTFKTPEEAKKWGMFQLQAIREQYSYFNMGFRSNYKKKVPKKTEAYIGGMLDIQIQKHFEDFCKQNAELFKKSNYNDIISIVKI